MHGARSLVCYRLCGFLAAHVQPGAPGAIGLDVLLQLCGCVEPGRLHEGAVPRERRRRLTKTAQRVLTALVMQPLHRLRSASIACRLPPNVAMLRRLGQTCVLAAALH